MQQPPAALALSLAICWVGAAAAAGDAAGGTEVAASEAPGQVLCEVTAYHRGEPSEVKCEGRVFTHEAEGELEVPGSQTWWRNLILAFVCVCIAAFAAGLTLGMLSLDPFQLRVLCNRSINDVEPSSPRSLKAEQDHLVQEQARAQRILPVISGHYFGGWWPRRCNPSNEHYLLVTLLLTNAAANEALPIFLDGLVPSWLAVILSVTVVLLFGEIVPSAIFTGPHQLKLAACLVPVVRVLRLLYLPVVLPISLVLDVCLGHEEDDHDRGELKALARTLAELHGPEVKMIHGVLEMHAKAPSEVSRPIAWAKRLAGDEIIDEETVSKLLSWGHSRIFVYRRDPEDPTRSDDIIGVLLVKKLLGVPVGQGVRVDSCQQALKEPIVLGPSDNLLGTLTKFQAGMCHLAVVSDSPSVLTEALQQGKSAPVSARAKMFCSLEDVIEAMMNEKILDEADLERSKGRIDSPAQHGHKHDLPHVPHDRIFVRVNSLHGSHGARRLREATTSARLGASQ